MTIGELLFLIQDVDHNTEIAVNIPDDINIGGIYEIKNTEISKNGVELFIK